METEMRYEGPTFNALIDVMKETERKLRDALDAEYCQLALAMKADGKSFTEINRVLRQTAIDDAGSSNSNWSGGHSVNNLAEQVRREFALKVARREDALRELRGFDRDERKSFWALEEAES